jgi:hypothetical protein
LKNPNVPAEKKKEIAKQIEYQRSKLKQGVAEGSIGDKIKGAAKSVKRAAQGWDKNSIGPGGEKLGDPRDIVKRAKSASDDSVRRLAKDKELGFPFGGDSSASPHSPRGLQKRVLDREMKKRGLDEQGVAEGTVIYGEPENKESFKVTYYDPKYDEQRTSTIKARNETAALDYCSSKGYDVIDIQRQGVAEGVEKTIWVKPSSNHTLIVVKSSSPDIEAGEEYDEGDLNNYANNFGYKIKEQGVAEGWKEKVAGGVLGAAALGGIGAGIAYSPMAYVNGQQIQMAMPTSIPDNAKLVTADDGRKIYVWKSNSIKGRTVWHYRPAEQVKEQGVAEGWKQKVGAGLTAAALATGASGVVLNPARPIGPKGQTVANPYPNKVSSAKSAEDDAWAKIEKRKAAEKKGVAEGLSKRDQQDVDAIKAAIARLEAQLNHPNADRDAIQQSIAHEKKRLALYGQGVTEDQRLDPSCWKGYKKQGTKMKGGTRVNNCVPVKESAIMKGLKS